MGEGGELTVCLLGSRWRGEEASKSGCLEWVFEWIEFQWAADLFLAFVLDLSEMWPTF